MSCESSFYEELNNDPKLLEQLSAIVNALASVLAANTQFDQRKHSIALEFSDLSLESPEKVQPRILQTGQNVKCYWDRENNRLRCERVDV